MTLFGFDGIEPGAPAGQSANHEADPVLGLLDELMVRVKPMRCGLAPRPGDVIPYQQQGLLT